MREYAVAPEATTLPVPQGLHLIEAAALARDHVHRLAQRLRARRAEARRMATRPWRHERHRHDRDPARNGARRQGHGDGRKRREVRRACRGARRRCAPSTTRKRISSRRCAKSHGGHGADVILDMVGGDYVERNLRAAALDGRIVQIAFLKGSKVEIDLMRLMMRRLTLTGSTLRAQSPEAKARMAKAIEERVWPLFAEGKLKPVIDFDLQARTGGRCPPPHRSSRPYRQDRAGDCVGAPNQAIA